MALTATFAADFTQFEQSLSKATVKLATFDKATKNAARDLKRDMESLSGQKAAAEAAKLAVAIQRVGGASKLTASELQRASATVVEAQAKFKALGMEAPASLQKLAREIQDAEKAARSFGDRVGAMSTSLQSLGTKMQSAGMTMSAAITLPLVGLGVAAIKAGTEFESSINKIQGVLRPTAGEMEAVRKKAIEMGAATAFSATDAANAMLELGKAGFTTGEALASVDKVLELAAASGLDMGAAAEMAARTMNAFGLETKDLGHVNDVLAKAINLSTLEIGDLQTAFKYVGPIAQGFGVSIETATAALSFMRDAGIAAETSGRALREGLSRLANPVKSVKEVMGELGIAIKDVNPATNTLSEIIGKLNAKGLTAAQALKLFGDAAGPGMFTLVQKGRPALEGLTADLEKSGGAAKDMADAMMKGLPGALERLRGSVETALLSLSKAAEPALLPFLSLLEKTANLVTTVVVPAFQAMPPGLQTATIAMLAFVAAIGPALIAMGSLVKLMGVAVLGLVPLNAGMITLANTVPILQVRLLLLQSTALGVGAALGAITVVLASGYAVWSAATEAIKLYGEHQERAGMATTEATRQQKMMAEAVKIAGPATRTYAEAVAIVSANARKMADAQQAAGKATADAGKQAAAAALKSAEASAKQAEGLEKAKEAAKKHAAELKKASEAAAEFAASIDFFGMRLDAVNHNALAPFAKGLSDAVSKADIFTATLAPLASTAEVATRALEGAWRATGLFAKEAGTAGVKAVSAFGVALKALPQAIIAAFQGGGDVLKTIGSSLGVGLGTDFVTKFGANISTHLPKFLGDAINSIIPGVGALLGPLLGKIGGFFKSLFGGVSPEIKAARTEVEKFQADLAKTLTVTQMNEAGGKSWAMTLIGVRDAFLAIGRTAGEAESLVAQLLNTDRPDAARAALEEINKVLGFQVEEQDLLNKAVDRYGFTIEQLGPAMQKQKLHDMAQELIQDWHLLTKSGIDVGLVTGKMADKVNEYLKIALRTGAEIPASMKPTLQSMIDLGLLTDADGNKLTDLSKIPFAETMTQGFNRIVEALERVALKLGNTLPAAANAAGEAFDRTFRGRITPAIDEASRALDEFEFGRSPGGLKEIPILLGKADTAVSSFKQKFGVAMSVSNTSLTGLLFGASGLTAVQVQLMKSGVWADDFKTKVVGAMKAAGTAITVDLMPKIATAHKALTDLLNSMSWSGQGGAGGAMIKVSEAVDQVNALFSKHGLPNATQDQLNLLGHRFGYGGEEFLSKEAVDSFLQALDVVARSGGTITGTSATPTTVAAPTVSAAVASISHTGTVPGGTYGYKDPTEPLVAPVQVFVALDPNSGTVSVMSEADKRKIQTWLSTSQLTVPQRTVTSR